MVLQSCQKQIFDLLTSSSAWINPSQNYIETAKYLSNLGLIRIQERHYIICSYRQDELDWPNVVDSNCNNEILIDEDFDEACDNIICEDCNRDILPNTYKKQRFCCLSVYLNPEKIMDWFEGQLSNGKFMWQKVERDTVLLVNKKLFKLYQKVLPIYILWRQFLYRYIDYS